MRILATLALIGIAFASPVFSAKAEAQGVLDPNTQQKLKNEIPTIENSNLQNTIDSLPGKTQIKSFNDNFLAPTYVAETNVLKYGPRYQVRLASYSRIPRGYFTINASAYTAAADECGKSDGITASGQKVAEGRTLACPKGYAFGTKIEIDGMGTYVCEDRGGAIKGNHFDIYMQTKKQAFAFGRRNLLAQIIQ